MSVTDLSNPPPPALSRPLSPRPVAPGLARVSAAWSRVALACLILLGSAGVRSWQARRIEADLAAGRRRPRIDLEAIPMTLGPWKGEATRIDPQIARGTGADQIVTRRYVHQGTGVAVDLILLYGPAVEMYPHAPELCYPAAGFTLAAGPEDREVVAGMQKAPFRSLVYAKGEGTAVDAQEVYYSWWYQGRWTPNAGNQKHFERIPSMYKVHTARRVAAGERRDIGNPSEAFLRDLLPEIERRMSATRSPSS